MPSDWPVLPTYAFLFVVACARGGATYALARGLRDASMRRRPWAERPAIQRAERLVSRYGAPAVSVSFLTIGVQTAVNAAAGVLRMPLRHYLPALALGAAVWALVYLTLGLAVIRAFWGGRGGLALMIVLLVVLLITLVTYALRRQEDVDDEHV